MVTRGFSSESVVQQLAEAALESGKPRVILSLNDYDPSGSLMLTDIIKRARHYAPHAHFVSEQVALTREQVTRYKLPTRPTKTTGNSHAAKFNDPESVELDAMDAGELRTLLREAIEDHVDGHELGVMLAAEASEREGLRQMAARAGR